MLAASMSWVVACGGDGGSGASALPADLKPGTKLSWNPTITVVDATHFTYVNDEANSKFTASISNGTYTYARTADSALLTLKGAGAGDKKLLDTLPAELTLRKADADGVSIEIDGETYAGTLEVPEETADEGDGGALGPTDDIEGKVPAGAVASTVNSKFIGEHKLGFGNPQTGAPFEAGAKATFVIGSDNTLTVMGKRISNPYELNGNKAEIIWNDGEYTWALSDNERGVFNEINLQKASDNTWLGQWADPSKFEDNTQGDIGKEVTLKVTASGGPQGVTIPLSSGMVTLSWDGAESLTFKIGDGVYSSAETYQGEEMVDGNRALNWTSSRGEIQGIEHTLTVDAADKIVRYREVSWKGEPANRVEAFAEATP